MNTFEGEIEISYRVSFPDKIWEMVTAKDWQDYFYTFETKKDFASFLINNADVYSYDFSKMDGFKGVEAAKLMKVVEIHRYVSIDDD